MSDIDLRIRHAADHALRMRLILLSTTWLGVPLLAVLLINIVDVTDGLLVYSITIATWWTAYYSGQSWKNPDRIKALLDDTESPVVVLRTLRGCFVVLTERRILVLTYNKLLDTPTGLLRSACLDTTSAELRSDGRLLTITEGERRMEFQVAERRRKTTEEFVSELG
ncbi:hypothetical protein [Streptomyces sp. UG1]|uniref:hypothetical protein n=1 Tax=Streptomyces sp. UG1 TaxID=3417652 RepID=UPI003CF7C499